MLCVRACLRVALLFSIASISAGASAAERAPWHEGFEGASISWKYAGGDVGQPLRRHRRELNGYAGRQSEYFQVVGQSGSSVFVAHDVGAPSVIPELKASLWVKADRPGIRIFVRVVLPRTKDPRSQTPVHLRLEGSSYTQVGRWQRLEVGNLPELLSQQVRGLRLRMGPQVDGLGAYVDQVQLNIYGGPGVTNVWVDELSLAGYAESSPPRDSVATIPLVRPSKAWTRRVQRDGSVEVNHRRILPRAVRYRGESLERLKELGFNTVWLPGPASRAMLGEATRLDLMLICAPPDEVLKANRDPLAPVPKIGPEYNPVLAWDLGSELSEQQVKPVQELAGRIRRADDAQNRPVICRPDSNLRAYSNFIDLLMVGQSPLATSLELSDYGKWIRHRALLARPGTTIWSTVQTQPAPELREQWTAGGARASLPPRIAFEQMRLMAYTAIASGSRGLLFESSSRLDATDEETQARAAAIELVNLELDMARRWVTSGSLQGIARCSQPDVLGAVFEYHRTHLLVPLWAGPGAQYVPGQSAASELAFVARGIPESNRAYEIVPGGLPHAREKTRVSGGTRVTLGEFSLCSMVLFAEDRELIREVRREAQEIGPRAARLYRKLAAQKLEVIDDVDRRLSGRGQRWLTSDHLTTARKYLQRADGAMAAKDYRSVCLNADRAMRLLRLVERSNWEKAVRSLTSPIASPATVCFSTLPWHWAMVDQTYSWRSGPNLIGGGEFESVQAVMAAGWGHFKHGTLNVEADGAVIPKAAHAGEGGLRLAARPTTPDQSPTLVETAPVWVTSPQAYVEAGSLVRIQAWIHIPTPLTGSVDGVKMFDSMGGQALAERIGETTGWQRFTLFRFAPRSGPLTVTFALCGLGEVWIDDVAIQVLSPTAGAIARPSSGPARRY